MAETALVTGASVGIGLELAKLLAADGYQLVLVARDLKKLETVAADLRKLGSPLVHVLPKDLAKPESCEQIAQELCRQKIDIDILINNAGFGMHGSFASTDPQCQLDLLQVNIVALTHLTRLLLPAMIQRRRGKIMNLSSMAAFVPGPLMAVYYASKAYVLSLSLALSDECRDKGVSVTVVCPGPTETEFFSRASIGGRPLFSAHMMSAPAVAKIGYRAMLAGKPMSVTGLANSFLAQTTRLVPRMFAGHMAGKRNRMRDAKT